MTDCELCGESEATTLSSDGHVEGPNHLICRDCVADPLPAGFGEVEE